ncbi:MAG: CvpA family protein [Oscillospiraceae bacterium]|nr:CvpA family protein [Oscillospiraceae bacterium]
MVSIIIDVVIVLLIAFCTYRGYKKGLIGVAYSIVAFFVAILIAWTLTGPVTNFIIDHTDFNDRLQSTIVDKLGSQNNQDGQGNKTETNLVFGDYIDNLIQNTKDAGVQAVAGELSVLIIKVIVFIGLYILARLVLLLFRFLANIIAKLPIIKQFNKLGGIIFGCLKGVLIVYFILAVLLVLQPMMKDLKLYSDMNKSFIGNMMYNNNFILHILK